MNRFNNEGDDCCMAANPGQLKLKVDIVHYLRLH
jgi:hypothetical protein